MRSGEVWSGEVGCGEVRRDADGVAMVCSEQGGVRCDQVMCGDLMYGMVVWGETRCCSVS